VKKVTVCILIVLAVSLLSGCQVFQKDAEFEVSTLSVTKANLTLEESTIVEATVKNNMDKRVADEVILKINGEVHESEEVTLDAKETIIVSFTVSFEEEGEYEVSVANQKSTITVLRSELAMAPDLLKSAPDFLMLLSLGEYAVAAERFDTTMKKALPVEKLRGIWEGIVNEYGLLKWLGEGIVFEEQGFQIVEVKMNFGKGALKARVVFDNDNLIAGLNFSVAETSTEMYVPPNYVSKEKFFEKELVFGAKGWELSGTLTMPKGEGPFPTLILVHGSGPQDRDQSIGPNKPFKDLAWGLASKKIAVFRYDKRTKVHGQKMGTDFTVEEEVIEDALFAMDLLRRQEGIDPEGIFLLGHSMGGMLAPEIANRDGNVAGVLVLAGPTRTLLELILEQTEYISLIDGKIDEAEQKNLEDIKGTVTAIENRDFVENEIVFGAPAAYWYDLIERKPIDEALNLHVPLLVLQGGRDYQVTIEDFEGWKEGLSEKEYVVFSFYPDLNHLFMEGEDKSTPKEYLKSGNVYTPVIMDIAYWILAFWSGS